MSNSTTRRFPLLMAASTCPPGLWISFGVGDPMPLHTCVTGFWTHAGGRTRVMTVGLVLGAGGVMGGAWLTGALEALAAETGWDPGSADRIVGTSAGAMIGGLVAAGVGPRVMGAHSAGGGLAGGEG